MVLWRVGLYRKRVVKPLVSIQAGDRDHAVIYLSNPAQILFSYMSRCLAVLAVSSLIYKQGSALLRSRLGVFEHQLYPAPIDLFRVPAGLREKPLQRLRLFLLGSYHRLGALA